MLYELITLLIFVVWQFSYNLKLYTMCDLDLLLDEELNGGDFMCNNCGGGFTRDEIVTDEDGDDYCTSCK